MQSKGGVLPLNCQMLVKGRAEGGAQPQLYLLARTPVVTDATSRRAVRSRSQDRGLGDEFRADAGRGQTV